MSQSDTFESNIAKPSWCLLVIVMYFIPAAFTSATHAAGSNFTGSNCGASVSYSETVMPRLFITHSPLCSRL